MAVEAHGHAPAANLGAAQRAEDLIGVLGGGVMGLFNLAVLLRLASGRLSDEELVQVEAEGMPHEADAEVKASAVKGLERLTGKSLGADEKAWAEAIKGLRH